MAEDFVAQFKVQSPVYVDSQRILYKALGLTASKVNMLNPKMVLSGMKVAKKGFVQGNLQGHPWQLGGVVVLLPSGQMPYVYRSTFAGDHPEVNEVIGRVSAL